MKNVINIYKKHKITVDNYIKNLLKSFQTDPVKTYKSILNDNKYIELIYAVDENYTQTTPKLCRNSTETDGIGNDKSHYFMKLKLDDDGVYISNPYIHYRTGQASISVVHFKNNQYHVYDIHLIRLLEELKLIEFNEIHDKFKRSIYLLGSSVLSIISIILIGYGIYVFASLILLSSELDLLNDIFKSIIAVTLGLAIFDLAKQIFEHEVLFQTLEVDEEKQYKVLGNFLISIIIALSIETLLVVFKIALSSNPENMLSAFYLIIGTTIMVVGLGWFHKTIKSN